MTGLADKSGRSATNASLPTPTIDFESYSNDRYDLP